MPLAGMPSRDCSPIHGFRDIFLFHSNCTSPVGCASLMPPWICYWYQLKLGNCGQQLDAQYCKCTIDIGLDVDLWDAGTCLYINIYMSRTLIP